VLDELRAFLRVCDVLTQNLIFQADAVERRARHMSRTDRAAVKNLEREIRACGVSFTIRQVIYNLLCEYGNGNQHTHSGTG